MSHRNQGSNWIRRSTRLAIYDRDDFACVYCGTGAEDTGPLTLDHVAPRELGGSDKPRNLVTSCARCNVAKADLPVADFIATLPDGNGVAARVRSQLRKKLDRKRGRVLLAARTI